MFFPYFWLKVRPNTSAVLTAVPQLLKFLIMQEYNEKCCLLFVCLLFSYLLGAFYTYVQFIAFALSRLLYLPPDSFMTGGYFLNICPSDYMNTLKEPSDNGEVIAKIVFHAKTGELVLSRRKAVYSFQR